MKATTPKIPQKPNIIHTRSLLNSGEFAYIFKEIGAQNQFQGTKENAYHQRHVAMMLQYDKCVKHQRGITIDKVKEGRPRKPFRCPKQFHFVAKCQKIVIVQYS